MWTHCGRNSKSPRQPGFEDLTIYDRRNRSPERGATLSKGGVSVEGQLNKRTGPVGVRETLKTRI